MPKKKPRTKEKEVRIREIQAAAKKLFFKKGYQNTTIRAIADKAKVSPGTVYLYYKGKDDLYVALMIPSLAELSRVLSRLEKELEEEGYADRDIIMDIYRSLRSYYEYDPDGVRILQAFQLGDLFPLLSKKSLQTLQDVGSANQATARRIFSNAIEHGLLPDVDVNKLADFIWGLFLGITQIEENKRRWSKKDHILSTLEFGYKFLSDLVTGSYGLAAHDLQTEHPHSQPNDKNSASR